MTMQTTWKDPNEIVAAWLQGVMTRDEAAQAIRTYFITVDGVTPEEAEEGVRLLIDQNPRQPIKPLGQGQPIKPLSEGAKGVDKVFTGLGGGAGGGGGAGIPEPPLDDFTRYLQQFGLAGRTGYNPAEQYQASLFDPLRRLYETGQGLYARGLPGMAAPRTFQDFLGGGVNPTGQAQSLLRNIYGLTPEQKRSTGTLGLGYEPGGFGFGESGEETGRLDQGNIGELQALLRYGLRPTAGTYGAKYIAGALPELQQAYYGQRQTPGAIGAPGAQGVNFLDWLKSKYGFAF